MRPSALKGHGLVVLGIDPGLRATGWGVLALVGLDEGLVEESSLSARGSTGSPRAKLPSHSSPLTLSLSKGGVGREELTVLGYGAVTTETAVPLPERLRRLFVGLREVIGRWQPAEVAVEEAFVAANKRVAIAMGEARGVALLAAAEAGLPVFEYSASEAKQAVSGYGRGSKEQVQEMLRLQLGLEAAPQPADAADALATALCHLMRRRAEARLAAREKPLPTQPGG
jgi:crossover junction endodeoxyribonuclease RuvC